MACCGFSEQKDYLGEVRQYGSETCVPLYTKGIEGHA
jgi:hypothetical protein